jgi:sulfur carrier protein ThiS
MVKKRVKLYGTLSKLFPDYQHSEGLEVEIGEGTKVKDLLVLLGIPESTGAVVAMEGRILKSDDEIDRDNIHVFQAMQGG